MTAGTLTIGGASVGTKQGFSIIKYAGSGSNSLFPHGLTQTPDFYIIKCLDVSDESWRVYHKSIGAEKYLTLNTLAAAVDSNTIFDDTEPTSTTASVYAGYDGVNNTGRNYIAYLWHDVPGLQKFGYYRGSATEDGPHIWCGFRPAFIIIKRSEYTYDAGWILQDSKRGTYNPVDTYIYANTDDNESGASTSNHVDFLSNGFKLRTNQNKWNANYDYVYAAWAEAPFKYSNAR